MEAQIANLVQESLSLYLYDNACFLAERLVAEYPNEGNKYLLATCYFHNQQINRAYYTLQGCTQPSSRYLLAMLAYKLGRLAEATDALQSAAPLCNSAMAAACHYQIARIAQLSSRHDDAVQHYKRALDEHPLLWCAYRELCTIDPDAVDVIHLGSDFVPVAPTPDITQSTTLTATPLPAITRAAAALDDATPMQSMPTNTPAQQVGPVGGHTAVPAAPTFLAPVATPGAFVTPSPMPLHRSGAPPALPRAPPHPRAPHRGAHASEHSTRVHKAASSARHRMLDDPAGGKVRKVSGRLFGDGSARRSTRSSSNAALAAQQHAVNGGGAVEHSGDGPNAHTITLRSTSTDSTSMGTAVNEVGYRATAALLHTIVQGYQHLCSFQCVDAIATLRKLPVAQYDTAWVFVQLGRAYCEAVDYHKAEAAFAHARARDPYSLEGMEVYSTVLWHMRKEVELSHLAQDAMELDRLAPQTWCIMGNCFSLQREHETALKCFTRALQLDPAFTYAYTLRGHELFANEDFDEAIKSYRQATRINNRHYNAWYGMGQIYLRQEKFKLAEQHFARALQFHPQSSVLRCYMATSQAKQGKTSEALRHLEVAIQGDPKNPLAHLERANVLIAEGNRDPAALEAALQQLLKLKDMIPKEASVHFQLGKLCKRLRRPQDALAHFMAALDLQPPVSDVNLIKSAIEKVDVVEDGDVGEM